MWQFPESSWQMCSSIPAAAVLPVLGSKIASGTISILQIQIVTISAAHDSRTGHKSSREAENSKTGNKEPKRA